MGRAPFSRTVFDLVEEQASKSPDAAALVSGDKSLSYSELVGRARKVGAGLRAFGVRRGDRVGVLINNRHEWLEICLGASAVGAVTIPFSTWSTRYELDFLLHDSCIDVLFALSRLDDRDFVSDLQVLVPEAVNQDEWRSRRYPGLRGLIFVDADGARRASDYRAFVERAPMESLPPGEGASASDDFVILYTSGSSNRPKGVRLSHFGTIENGFNIGERMGLSGDDRVLLSPPLFWAYGCANALPATLTHGACLVLQAKFEPTQALDLIERHRCTALYTLPGMTNSLVRHPAFGRSRTRSLRTGVTIGSPEDIKTAAQILGAPEICNVYGATETYGNCCVSPHEWSIERRAVYQQLLPGTQIRVVHVESGAELPIGTDGLIEIKGYITPGYVGASAEHNATAFTSDGYFKSGDIGRLTDTGEFVFVGRSTEIIKRAGINVSPTEVEEILRQHTGVIMAGVVGTPDADKGELIVAFVIPADGVVLSADSLRAHCRTHGSKYKVPDIVYIRPSLPFTVTGKLMRRELKTLAAGLRQDAEVGT
jgi:fatty-acyl-CoA synthase